MLNILLNSPFKIDIQSMIEVLKKRDTLVALQDGVLIALNGNIVLNTLLKKSITLYVLKEDVLARGILDHICDNCNVINYSQFVTLTQNFSKYMNW
ncbi:sulfurtransferase complex subunit TusB [Buchnera aphidicola]|uniref:sulfurtransferase complex subunit TusB n=1 Tax=Buchnera aphidicola TaxID=9 RepID=UPI003464A18D